MIEIVFKKDRNGRVQSLSCSGHAGFSASEDGGVDIVCSAVSALTGFLGLTISEVMLAPEAVGATDGAFELRRPADWGDSHDETLDVMLGGWERAVRSLEENYSGWVRVVEVAL